jgi:small subunit ribosomal protein S17e
MGRIKTKQIKATTFALLETYNSRFSKDFADNKRQMVDVTTYHSKKMRNAIAGYLARLKKASQK